MTDDTDHAKENARQAMRLDCTRSCVKCGKLVIPPEDAPMWTLVLVKLLTLVAPGGLQCRECAEL